MNHSKKNRSETAAKAGFRNPFLRNAGLIIKLGSRNILRQKRRSLLVITSAMSGVIGVLFTMAIVNGFLNAMIENGIESGIGHVQVRPNGWDESRKTGLTLENAAEIGRLLESRSPEKAEYAARLEKEGLLRIGNFTAGVLLTGIDPQQEKNVSRFFKWTKGNFFQSAEKSQDSENGIMPCIIGKANADKMEVGIGDWAVISLNDRNGVYRSARCTIEGIFASGVEPLEKFTVLLRKSDLSEMFAGSPDLTGYFVFLADSESQAESMKAELKEIIPPGAAEILTYKEIERLFSQIIEMNDSFSWILYLILLLGVALILFDSIMMSVFERVREIGILRALGTKPGFIFSMILFESVLLALAGSAAGIAVGEIFVLYFQFFGMDLSFFAEGMETFDKLGTTIYPYLTPEDILEALYIPVIISFFAGIVPAWKAVRLSPVRAIYKR